MTPDTIPSRLPVTITLERDEAWLLGVVVVAGLWILTVGICWLGADALRWLNNRNLRMWK